MTTGDGTLFVRRLIGLGLVIAGGIAIVVYFFTLAVGEPPLSNRYPYGAQAVVPTAVQLAQNADVREAGVKVGKVAEISNRGATAVLGLRLDSDHSPVYRDARVRVRTKTPAGENYVDLDPGTPQAGRIPNGGLIPIQNALPAVQVDEVLSTLDAPTRRRLRRLLDSLGAGLEGRGGENLNRFLEGSSDLVERSSPTLDVLGRQREDVATLVESFGRVMRALGDRSASIRVLSRRLRVEAEAVAARDSMLAATIEVLPSTLRQARATTTQLGGFAGHATPVLGDLAHAFDRLVPAMTALRPGAREGRAVLRELGRFDRAGTPLLRELGRFSKASNPVMPKLDGFLREVNPLMRYLAPYSPELGAYFSNLSSATSSVQGPGHIGRVHGMISSSTLTSYPPELQGALKALLESGAFGLAAPLGNNAYPKPGEMADPSPFSGQYPRLMADPPARRRAR